MKNIIRLSILLLICSTLFAYKFADDWGFFGHRRINRMAVFTLPPEMMVFYKKNIDYITEHAVDPDKRRYATKHEAHRHYIDIDHWGEPPFTEVPRNWTDCLMKYTDVFVVDDQNDTLLLFGNEVMTTDDAYFTLNGEDIKKITNKAEYKMPTNDYKDFFKKHIQSLYYEDEWILNCDILNEYLTTIGIKANCQSSFAIDRFSAYGILPYHLEKMQLRLMQAFQDKNANRILRLSAEFGHYIGDAHVPLHTTENYNGQMTNQVGIHGFWESRIPELFADKNYDYFVGAAEYIEDTNDYYWDVVLTSHSYLDSVFAIEKELSIYYPEDKQFCFEDRLESTIRTQCKEYAKAYSDRLEGQVETRMRNSIQAIGSAWFTAWVDAGQPDLSDLSDTYLTEAEKKELKETEESFNKGAIKGRQH